MENNLKNQFLMQQEKTKALESRLARMEMESDAYTTKQFMDLQSRIKPCEDSTNVIFSNQVKTSESEPIQPMTTEDRENLLIENRLYTGAHRIMPKELGQIKLNYKNVSRV